VKAINSLINIPWLMSA